MSNIELAQEKLEAARLILAAIDSYLETCDRLAAESRKLHNEALALITGGEHGTNQGNE